MSSSSSANKRKTDENSIYGDSLQPLDAPLPPAQDPPKRKKQSVQEQVASRYGQDMEYKAAGDALGVSASATNEIARAALQEAIDAFMGTRRLISHTERVKYLGQPIPVEFHFKEMLKNYGLSDTLPPSNLPEDPAEREKEYGKLVYAQMNRAFHLNEARVQGGTFSYIYQAFAYTMSATWSKVVTGLIFVVSSLLTTVGKFQEYYIWMGDVLGKLTSWDPKGLVEILCNGTNQIVQDLALLTTELTSATTVKAANRVKLNQALTFLHSTPNPVNSNLIGNVTQAEAAIPQLQNAIAKGTEVISGLKTKIATVQTNISTAQSAAFYGGTVLVLAGLVTATALTISNAIEARKAFTKARDDQAGFLAAELSGSRLRGRQDQRDIQTADMIQQNAATNQRINENLAAFTQQLLAGVQTFTDRLDQTLRDSNASQQSIQMALKEQLDSFKVQAEASGKDKALQKFMQMVNFKVQLKAIMESGRYKDRDLLNLAREAAKAYGFDQELRDTLFKDVLPQNVLKAYDQELDKFVNAHPGVAPEVYAQWRSSIDQDYVQPTFAQLGPGHLVTDVSPPQRVHNPPEVLPTFDDEQKRERGPDEHPHLLWNAQRLGNQNSQDRPVCNVLMPFSTKQLLYETQPSDYQSMFEVNSLKQFETNMDKDQAWAVNQLEHLLTSTGWANQSQVTVGMSHTIQLNKFQAYWLYRWMGPLCTKWLQGVAERAPHLSRGEPGLLPGPPMRQAAHERRDMNEEMTPSFLTETCKKRFLFLKAALSTSILHLFFGKQPYPSVTPRDKQEYLQLECLATANNYDEASLFGKVIMALDDCLDGMVKFVGLDNQGKYFTHRVSAEDFVPILNGHQTSWGTDERVIVANVLDYLKRKFQGKITLLGNQCWKMSRVKSDAAQKALYLDADASYMGMNPSVMLRDASGKDLYHFLKFQKGAAQMLSTRLKKVFADTKNPKMKYPLLNTIKYLNRSLESYVERKRKEESLTTTKMKEQWIRDYHATVKHFALPVKTGFGDGAELKAEERMQNAPGHNTIPLDRGREIYAKMLELNFIKQYLPVFDKMKNPIPAYFGVSVRTVDMNWNDQHIETAFVSAMKATGLRSWPDAFMTQQVVDIKKKLYELANDRKFKVKGAKLQGKEIPFAEPVWVPEIQHNGTWHVVDPMILIVGATFAEAQVKDPSWQTWVGDWWFINSLTKILETNEGLAFCVIKPLSTFHEELAKQLELPPELGEVQDSMKDKVKNKFLKYFKEVLYSGFWSSVVMSARNRHAADYFKQV